MSSASALTAVRRAAAMAAGGCRPAAKCGATRWQAPAAAQTRQMQIARAECLALPTLVRGLEAEIWAQAAQVAEALQAPAAARDAAAPQVAKEVAASASEAKLAACQSLAEEALCGEARAAADLVALLQDAGQEVRGAALEATLALAHLAPRHVVAAAVAACRGVDAGLRWRSAELDLALDALATCAEGA